MARDIAISESILDVLSQLRRDPTIIASWEQKKCNEVFAWLCSNEPENPVFASEDYTSLHCLLRTATITVDSLFKQQVDPAVETALSLALLNNNPSLVRYLLKMAASPDILVGWNLQLHKSCSFAFDRVDGESEVFWRRFILQYCKEPCRVSEQDPLTYPVSDSGFLEWVQGTKISNFDQGVEYDVSQIKLDPISVRKWSRLHTFFVFAKLVKRRPGGPIAKDFPVIDVLLSGGQISVNDYLVDAEEERITALYEAVTSKNVAFVRHLLSRHKADPNKRIYVNAMPWHDQTQLDDPLSMALRGFLVWDDTESAAMRDITDLLLDTGISERIQSDTIEAIWNNASIVALMELLQALHFVKMVRRLVHRSPSIPILMQRPITYALPLFLKNCESKWMKEILEVYPLGTAHCFTLLLREAMSLLVDVKKLESSPIPPEVLESLVSTRSYRTLAALVNTIGPSIGLEQLDLQKAQLLDVPTPDMINAGQTIQTAKEVDAQRVRALVRISFRSTTGAQKWLPSFANLYGADVRVNGPVGTPFFSLKDRCIAVVNDLKRQGQTSSELLGTLLPAVLYQEVLLEQEFAVLERLTMQ